MIPLLTTGQGHLSCVTYGGEKAYGRRRHLYFYEDPVKNDIQLLSYYINKFKQEKAQGQREPTKGRWMLHLTIFRLSRSCEMKNLTDISISQDHVHCAPACSFSFIAQKMRFRVADILLNLKINNILMNILYMNLGNVRTFYKPLTVIMLEVTYLLYKQLIQLAFDEIQIFRLNYNSHRRSYL